MNSKVRKKSGCSVIKGKMQNVRVLHKMATYVSLLAERSGDSEPLAQM